MSFFNSCLLFSLMSPSSQSSPGGSGGHFLNAAQPTSVVLPSQSTSSSDLLMTTSPHSIACNEPPPTPNPTPPSASPSAAGSARKGGMATDVRFSTGLSTLTEKGVKQAFLGGYFKDDRNSLAFFDPPPYCVQTVHNDRTFEAFFDPSPLPIAFVLKVCPP